jgi:SPP1 gp7 family putative phage head morphogenesis protein
VDEFVRGAEDKYGLGSKHAETVARTNIQTAYQYGHYQRLDKQREAFPIWGFDIVKDGDTSDICAALENKAYPADHPIWDKLYPPNHYNCRTTVVPFESVEEAEAQGFTVMDAWPRTEAGGYFMPSEGFSSNIGTVPSLDAMLPGLEEARP